MFPPIAPPTGGALAACLADSQAMSAPVLPATTEQETWILVYVYESENPYNGVFCYVQSPLGLEIWDASWEKPEAKKWKDAWLATKAGQAMMKQIH